LRYCRSRVFTFVFFTQKLTGISSGQNNKSCRIIHNGSKKIGFAFFRFFCDFLRNLQETVKSLHYWSYPFAVRPLKSFSPLQLGPWAPAGGTLAEFRRTGGRVRPGAGEGRSTGPQGSIPSLRRGRGRAGDGPRRRTRAAAAVACRPARGSAKRGEGWRLDPLRILEGVPEGSVVREGKRRRSSASGGNGGRRRSKAGSSAC
jgi:hypothetical protein